VVRHWRFETGDDRGLEESVGVVREGDVAFERGVGNDLDKRSGYSEVRKGNERIRDYGVQRAIVSEDKEKRDMGCGI